MEPPIWDGSGVYRLSADGQSYVSIVDPGVTLARDQVGSAKVMVIGPVVIVPGEDGAHNR